MNNLETQLRNLKEDFDDLKKIVSPELEWEEHPNCEIFDNGKRIRKIRNEGWNTGIKTTKLLRRNEINTFKVKINHLNEDATGLQFGIARDSSNVAKFGVD